MKNKILLLICVLLGLLMLVFGVNKFAHFSEFPEMPEAAENLMDAFTDSRWLFPLIGIAEIIGGLLIIIPKTRALGAIILLPVIVGIFAFHLTMEPSGLPMGGILLAIVSWIIFENKEKYMPMIS